jgi:uncharacterized protein YjbI with pentapeptide repeats
MTAKFLITAAIIAATTFALPAQASITMNGKDVNGTQLNGKDVNGTQLNGEDINGTQLNGKDVNGTQLNGSSTEITAFEINAFELPPETK